MDEPGFPAGEGAVAHVLVDALGAELTIGGTDGHHLARARRLEPGETVTAADGRGAWRPYVVEGVGRGVVVLVARGDLRREPELIPGLAVAFALTKGMKPETVVRQLTELGVDAVLPVLADRSVTRPAAGREAPMVERFRRVAREAAMQARRARLPDIALPEPLSALVSRPDLVVAERGSGGPQIADEPLTGGWTLLVGPEGGFSSAEAEALQLTPRLAVGPHVLRAETAAVAAASVLTLRRRPGETDGASRA